MERPGLGSDEPVAAPATPIFEAVAAAAEGFLRAPYSDATVAEMLARLGRAARASRAYLFVERVSDAGDLVADQKLEWVAEGVAAQIDDPALQGWSYRDSDATWLRQRLAAGESVAGRVEEFSGALGELLRAQQIRSLLWTPVRIRDELWGFVGFDECREDRTWSEPEVMALRLGASVLGAAVERERAERELRDSEERYRDLIENASDAVWAIDLEGRFVTVNGALEELLRQPREEILGRSWRDVLPADQQAGVERAIRVAREAAKPVSAYELRLDRKETEPAWLEVRSHPVVRDGERIGFQGTGRDVTERRRLEERLRQAVRMEAWGRLAAGVARDFDSLMVTIRGYGESALARIRADDPLRAEVSEILLAAERAAEMTRELVAFGRQQPARPVAVEVAELLEQRMALLRRIAGEDIMVVNLAETPLGRIRVDPDLVEQALVALFLNARDAMLDGGRIEISSSLTDAAELAARGAPEAVPGTYVRLTLRDSGPGLAPEDAARLFEPFYSTQELGKGRGLGLSTVYGIVRQCDGYVFAESRPGEGTAFDLFFPLAEPARARPMESPAPVEPHHPEKPTVLLVEDEDLIRSLAEQILSERGYEVLPAANASEALDVVHRSGGRIDLLLTDIVMPGASGSDLAQRLLRRHPDMKVLYMSGYSDSLIFRYGVLQDRAAFLQKPFSADVLERKVRDLIGA